MGSRFGDVKREKEQQAFEVCCMSVVGHSRPMHSVPVPINVRCYSNSDIIVRRSEVTLRAINGLMHRSKRRLYSITSSAASASVRARRRAHEGRAPRPLGRARQSQVPRPRLRRAKARYFVAALFLGTRSHPPILCLQDIEAVGQTDGRQNVESPSRPPQASIKRVPNQL